MQFVSNVALNDKSESLGKDKMIQAEGHHEQWRE